MNMKLKPIYFLLLFIVFFFILYYLDKKDTDTYVRSKNNKNISIKKGTIRDVNEAFLTDSLTQKDLCFILFYVQNSDASGMMAARLEQLESQIRGNCFYKININQYPRLIYKYNISGVPSIIIFRKGADNKRIMGIVPYSNLEVIYKRETK